MWVTRESIHVKKYKVNFEKRFSTNASQYVSNGTIFSLRTSFGKWFLWWFVRNIQFYHEVIWRSIEYSLVFVSVLLAIVWAFFSMWVLVSIMLCCVVCLLCCVVLCCVVVCCVVLCGSFILLWQKREHACFVCVCVCVCVCVLWLCFRVLKLIMMWIWYNFYLVVCLSCCIRWVVLFHW